MLWLRLLKFIGVGLLFAGTVSVVLPFDMPQATRRKLAFSLVAPGFFATWGAGLALAGLAGHSLMSTWILASFALSILSIQGVIYAAAREGRAGVGASIVALLPLVATLALMVWRPA